VTSLHCFLCSLSQRLKKKGREGEGAVSIKEPTDLQVS